MCLILSAPRGWGRGCTGGGPVEREGYPLRTLIEYIIALLDLAAAEGRRFRRGLTSLLVGSVLILIAGLLILGGIGICISGVYAGFISVFHGSIFWAGIVTGLLTIFFAGAMLWVGKVIARG